MLAKGGTVTYTATHTTVTSNTYSSSDTTVTYVVVTTDNGWREVTVDDLETIAIKEPAQEHDEPDTGEMSVVAKPNRRLATVTGRRGVRPPQLASDYG
jgi:hypothetical protein